MSAHRSSIAGALYAFAAWMTTRPERLVTSSSDDAAPAAEAVVEFLTQHGLADVEPNVKGWKGDLTYLTSEFDASVWAAEFKRINSASDESVMLGWFANAIMAGYDHHARQQRDMIRELDVALNGEAGAAKQASLCDLVAQVERQRAVQIVNFGDGMVINFRAPDGRRATLHMDELLDALGNDAALAVEAGVVDTIRATIAAYPSVGPRLTVETVDEAAAKRAAGIKPSDARNLGVKRAQVPDECVATGESCSYVNDGPRGEMQCRYCGEPHP